MASLPDTLRRRLEKTVVEAREVAEAGARAAVERLAAGRPEPFAEMAPAERELRVQLRAHARQLGDPRKGSGEQETLHLVSECAYEHWHRMLFARFLAENRLLIHPEHGVPVTLAECEELAAQGGEKDGWALAGRFAARMLPAIFSPDDPVLSVRLAPEHQQALEKLLAGLPAEVFTAGDSLGWVYQFWQTKRKEEVNKSGKKIGADELPAVTQLFTEPYMVQFLLHNTLGAWWAGKVLAERPELAQAAVREEELRRACELPGCEWAYLRFVRTEEGGPWRPAAGTFEGWPERAAEITVLDPCCGSGHFLVEAFRILVSMRMAEEALSAGEACDAVLRQNLFGLEIDERCTQIAAFNLALAAWSYPGAGGYRPLPELHIACSGLAVGAKEEEWLRLAGKDDRLREGMRRLYRLFQDAPTLGSLIDPRREFEARPGEFEFDKGRFDELRPLLEQALAREEVRRDAQATEAGIAAQGMARAAALLAGTYTLVATNFPYIEQRKQTSGLRSFCSSVYPRSKGELAAVFLERSLNHVLPGGAVAGITPHNWLFLTTYRLLRSSLLQHATLPLLARLGPHAFDSISGEVVKPVLVFLQATQPTIDQVSCEIDTSSARTASEKSDALLTGTIRKERQAELHANPQSRIVFDFDHSAERLRDHASCLAGIMNGDSPRFQRLHWELVDRGELWALQQSTVPTSRYYGGCRYLIYYDEAHGHLRADASFRRKQLHDSDQRGRAAWGRPGVAVSQTGDLPVALFRGSKFDSNVAVIVPTRASHVSAIWSFCNTDEFRALVRTLDAKLNVTNATFEQVPFDLERWQGHAERHYPAGLPQPYSDDPTEWIFHGHPRPCSVGPALEPPWPTHERFETTQPVSVEGSNWALQVAIARLVGYRWPAELDPKMDLSAEAQAWVREAEQLVMFSAADGIVCIPPVRGEQPAADRLQRLLAHAFGAAWTPATMPALLDQVGFSGKALEEWLRDGFFEQHCQLFHQRPFVWHIWDGRRRDGFAALVNYHKLDRRLLERLAYDVLGHWIARQRQGAKAGERGADDRLAAAEALQKKLALILEGEPPHDIFVRWKPLHEQPIGWEPDLNDGVRMNIRPFVEAGVLRKNPKIQWTKDRGKEPENLRPKAQFPWFWKDGQFTGERVNDVHLSNAEKRAARERAKVGTI